MNVIKSIKLVNRCLNYQKTCLQSKRLTSVWFSQSQRPPQRHQNLVIDLSFEDLMTTSECHRLARDLYTIYSVNAKAPKERQFNVNVCQTPENSITLEYLRHYWPQIQTIDNFNIVNKSYLDLFPTQKLIYLSPDAEDLVEFNENDIYIIGGLVEKKIFKKDSNRMTYLKAKSEDISVRRLPIDHFINDKMKRGIVLYLPQVFRILMDVKSGHDWELAVRRHLPEWKLKVFEQISQMRGR